MGNKTLQKVNTDEISLANGGQHGNQFSILPCKEHVPKSLVTKLKDIFPLDFP